MFRQHLNGDDAIQTGVPRLVDLAIPPAGAGLVNSSPCAELR
jgi:hypothetical protein